MIKVIAVALQKGGVGKTTTAQHLAHGLAMRGRSVLMLDLDPQGSLTKRYDQSTVKYTMADALGVGAPGEELRALNDVVVATHADNLYLAACDNRLADTERHLARKSFGELQLDRLLNGQRLPFEYVVIDTPPGSSMLLLGALVAADDLVVPVQLSPMGFEGFAQIDDMVTEARDGQDARGNIRLAYRLVVPTFYQRGQQVSDIFMENLLDSEHPDYAGEPLPVSEPIPETTHFEKASAPRSVGNQVRALTIWEASQEDIAQRAGAAYMDVAGRVDTYA